MHKKLNTLKKTLEKFSFQYALIDNKQNIICQTNKFNKIFDVSKELENKEYFNANGCVFKRLDKNLLIVIKDNGKYIDEISTLIKIYYDEIGINKRKKTTTKDLLEILTFDYGENEEEVNKLISKKGLDVYDEFVLVYISYEMKPKVYVEEIAAKLFPKESYLGDVRIDQLEEIIYITLSKDVTLDDIIEYCNAIVQIHETEYNLKLEIGISGIFKSLKDYRVGIDKAKMALKMGESFFKNTKVYAYNKLGVAKILYALPEKFKNDFINETNKENNIELLDKELLHTCEGLFNNNLNISETARQLYIHRNTLVYRIEKVKKLTGLDVTNFDDASLLRTILLIKSSLKGA